MDALKKCLTPSGVKKALRELPSTLDETYERIIRNIPAEYSKQAFSVLQLLVVSYRPLTMNEVAEALAIDCEDLTFDPDENRLCDENDIFEICSTLVTRSVAP